MVVGEDGEIKPLGGSCGLHISCCCTERRGEDHVDRDGSGEGLPTM